MARGGKRAGAGRKPAAVTKMISDAFGEHLRLSEVLRRAGAEEIAAKALVEIADDKKASTSARTSAAIAILDRIHGKPVQAHQHSGPDGNGIPLEGIIRIELVDPPKRD